MSTYPKAYANRRRYFVPLPHPSSLYLSLSTSTRFVAFKYRLNTILETIARETGHSRETVIARMETGALNFATTEVVHSTMKSSAAKKSSAPIEIEPPLQEITE